MTIDFYQFRDEIKKAIYRRLEQIEFENPNDLAWLFFALSDEEKENNPSFKSKFENMIKWIESSDSLDYERNLTSYGLVTYILGENDKKKLEFREKIINNLNLIRQNPMNRFSIYNNPELLYGVILGLGEEFDEDLRNFLVENANKKKVTGSLNRRLLFEIILFELKTIELLTKNYNDLNEIDEVISFIWLNERYLKNKIPNIFDIDLWNKLYLLKDNFSLNLNDEDEYVLSTFSLVILYKSLKSFLKSPNPKTLYNLLPLESKIKLVTKDLFYKGEYLLSVTEASKELEVLIKEKSRKNKYGRILIKEAFEVIDPTTSKPILVFNNYSDIFEIKEHDCLTKIIIALFEIFRNPPSHFPKYFLSNNPYEAIEQIILFNYIYRRIYEKNI